MKRGQLLSQPFFYIFMIIVIGLIIVFGFSMIKRLMGTACQVENNQFVYDLQDDIDEINSLFPGSSKECAVIGSVRQSDLECKLIMPSGIGGFCFANGLETSDYSKVKNEYIKDELELLDGIDKNLFFEPSKEGCEVNSIKLKNVNVPKPICVSNKPINILLKNTGDQVEITESR